VSEDEIGRSANAAVRSGGGGLGNRGTRLRCPGKEQRGRQVRKRIANREAGEHDRRRSMEAPSQPLHHRGGILLQTVLQPGPHRRDTSAAPGDDAGHHLFWKPGRGSRTRQQLIGAFGGVEPGKGPRHLAGGIEVRLCRQGGAQCGDGLDQTDDMRYSRRGSADGSVGVAETLENAFEPFGRLRLNCESRKRSHPRAHRRHRFGRLRPRGGTECDRPAARDGPRNQPPLTHPPSFFGL
jgi:hypothetical protein